MREAILEVYLKTSQVSGGSLSQVMSYLPWRRSLILEPSRRVTPESQTHRYCEYKKGFVALSHNRKWNSPWMAQRKKLLRLLRGVELNHRAQGMVMCQPQTGNSRSRFRTLESKGKRNSVTRAFYVWGEPIVTAIRHSHSDRAITGGSEQRERLSYIPACLFPLSHRFPACLSTGKTQHEARRQWIGMILSIGSTLQGKERVNSRSMG